MAVKKPYNPRAVQDEFLRELTGRRTDLAWRQTRCETALVAFAAADAAWKDDKPSTDCYDAREAARNAADAELDKLHVAHKSLAKLLAWGEAQGFKTEPRPAPKPAPAKAPAEKRREQRVRSGASTEGFNTPFAGLAGAIGTFDSLVEEAEKAAAK